ncbi:MAG TPA: baseplate J/gp47 family protein [Candidatus Dojkabacteria bacterium]|nr:baseplate J/gp47 family protein [Candidatus Dojkabacteria bacterium]
MEETSRKITKIVVGKDDELTDIVAGIVGSTNERVLLTFAEESDLLISAINLSVLLETADENDKLMIAQIIKNPTGVRNANTAGITTIETTTLPEEEVWIKEVERKAERLTPKTEEKVEKKDEIAEEGISIGRDIAPEEPTPIHVPTPPVLPKEEKPQIKESVVRERKKKEVKSKTKKILMIIVPIVLVLLGLIAFIYYKTAPFVRIRIYTESREVEIEKIFTGDANIKEIDFEDLKIPIKKEEVEKARSTTIKATGTAYKGEKAKGKVGIAYNKDGGCTDVEPLNLPAGTILVSSGGKYFKLDTAISIPCSMTPVEASVTANEIGTEYNLPQGTSFSVQNYAKSEVYGMASAGGISGGTKEEYTVLQQEDISAGMEELKKIAKEEAETELKDKSGGSWEIIQSSMKSDVVKDSLKTGVPVGSETKETSLDLKVVSEATYFLKEGFDAKLSELLTDEAKAKNLFETEKDLELTLGDEVEKDISVAESSEKSTKIKVFAKASVEPKVDKLAIISELKGKKWNEGLEILKKYVFSEKETDVVFEPKKFPSALKYFPTRQGAIEIELKKAD